MNKIFLMGRLTRSPELTTSQSGSNVCRFSIAVDRRFKKDGDSDTADFFNVVAFGKTAEFVEKWFDKGMKIMVCGRAEMNKYTDKEGNNRSSLSIICEEVHFADSQRKKESTDNSNDGADFHEMNDDEDISDLF